MKEVSYGIVPYLVDEDYNIKILLCKSNKDSLWGFFKGKQEPNETIKETALREFFEEAGVQLETEKLENFFWQTSKRKNIGLFLYDFSLFGEKKLKTSEREIFSYEYIDIGQKNISNIEKNQRILYKNLTSFLFQKKFYLNLTK